MVYLTRQGTRLGQIAISRPKFSLWWVFIWVTFLISAYLLNWLDVILSDLTGNIMIATAATVILLLLNLLYRFAQKRLAGSGVTKQQKSNGVLLLLGAGGGFGISLAILVFILGLYAAWYIFSIIASG